MAVPMNAMNAELDGLNWDAIGSQLDADGFAVLPGLLGVDVARDLARQITESDASRWNLDSGSSGCGECLYFGARLPSPLEELRSALYRSLVPIANRWNETLAMEQRYPAALEDFLQRNGNAGQTRPQSHLNRLGAEDFIALHQHNGGEHVFPLQVIALLSEPGIDFDGGEWVMTEQRPRMQSRPMVLPLQLGDAAIIATAQRPFKGAQGHYRVNTKHAVSRVRKGERIGLELSFHNAP